MQCFIKFFITAMLASSLVACDNFDMTISANGRVQGNTPSQDNGDTGADTGSDAQDGSTDDSTDGNANDDSGTDNGDTGQDTGSGTDDPVAQSVTLQWAAPVDRMNGDLLDMAQISGYAIRYKRPSDTDYQTVYIAGAEASQYTFDDLDLSGEGYQFEIATLDLNGFKSEFITTN